MIIELTGIPGSGKSSVLKAMSIALTERQYIFDIKKYLLGFNGNTFLFDVYLLFNFYRLSRNEIKLLKEIFNILINSKNSLFHKINIMRNAYKRIIIYLILKNKNKIFFVDEGVSHIPFTLFVDVDNQIDKDRFTRFIKLLPTVDRLLIIDADDDILLQRVIKRGKQGHRRINFDSDRDVKLFMEQSREVLNSIENASIALKYRNIYHDIDVDSIKQIIGLNNV